MRRTVLIADPDATIRRQLVRSLGERLTGEDAVTLQTCESVESALSLLRGGRIAVAYFEQAMLVSGGSPLANVLGEVDVVVAARTQAIGRDIPPFVRAFVERPTTSSEAAVYAIMQALTLSALRESSKRAERRAEIGQTESELIFASKSMRALVGRARRVAATITPVLIVGEPGTGKELLARLIYRVSQRGALLSLDASELSREDMDREILRSRDADTPSALERARGGTLLIFHLERLSPQSQEALANHIAGPLERAPNAAGRVNTASSSGARIIATASASLRENVESGAMSRDLFLGLGRPLLEIPALRQRRDDIPLLANHFLLQFLRMRPEAPRDLRIGVEAMRALRRAPWPRNVGELEAAIVHAALVAKTSTLVPGDLPDEEGAHRALRPGLGEEAYGVARSRVIGEFEKQYVDELLSRTAQNLAQAAREAGMDRANFRRLVKRAHGASRPRARPGEKKGPAKVVVKKSKGP